MQPTSNTHPAYHFLFVPERKPCLHAIDWLLQRNRQDPDRGAGLLDRRKRKEG